MKTMSKISRIAAAICEIIIGILLLINPVGFTSGIIVFIGIVLADVGIADIVEYFRTSPERAILEQGLTRGLIGVLAGFLLISKSSRIIVLFPIITVIYGVGILILGINKIQLTVDMIRLKVPKWFWAAISAALTVLCAVIIICDPFSSTTALWIFIAAALIVGAIIDVITVIFVKTEDKTE
ncbi:MAG: DUF308 domain-containing protein [Huintestinicola sp.]